MLIKNLFFSVRREHQQLKANYDMLMRCEEGTLNNSKKSSCKDCQTMNNKVRIYNKPPLKRGKVSSRFLERDTNCCTL